MVSVIRRAREQSAAVLAMVKFSKCQDCQTDSETHHRTVGLCRSISGVCRRGRDGFLNNACMCGMDLVSPLSLMLLRMLLTFFSGRTMLAAALKTLAKIRGAEKLVSSLAAACMPPGKLSDRGARLCRAQLLFSIPFKIHTSAPAGYEPAHRGLAGIDETVSRWESYICLCK